MPHLVHENDRLRGISVGGRLVDSIIHNATDPEEVLRLGASRGITHHVLSPWVAMIPVDLPPLEAAAIARLHNQLMAEVVNSHDEFEGLAAVPLQDPDLALEVLEEALNLGLKGVELTTAVAGLFIGDERFDRFWAGAEQLNAPVFIHPTTRGIDLAPFGLSYLWNSVGNPMETTVAASQLIMRGTLERHPRLKVVLAHGGGALPALIGRIDHSSRVRPEPALLLDQPPSESFRRFYFDTVTHDPELLRYLITKVGVGHVVFGTDHPFDMGSYDIHGPFDALGLSTADRAKILDLNIAGLLTR
jgi:aminocarboxymuconate-semialdehyde decarboxylase